MAYTEQMYTMGKPLKVTSMSPLSTIESEARISIIKKATNRPAYKEETSLWMVNIKAVRSPDANKDPIISRLPLLSYFT